jgi:hypothetical protein
MNSLKPINLQNPAIKARSASTRAGRNIVMALLSILIVSATISWFGILGWGFVEILQLAATSIKKLWTTFL